MRFCIAFVYFIFLHATVLIAQSAQIQGKFINLDSDKSLKVGDTFQGKLEIWPTNQKKIDFKKEDLIGKIIMGLFFTQNIESINQSANNNEVLEILGQFMLVREFKDQTLQQLKLNETSIGVSIEGMKLEQLEGEDFKNPTFLFSNAPFKIPSIAPYVIGGFLFLLVLSLAYFFLLKRKKKRRLQEEIRRRNQLKKTWTEKFNNACERKQFEEIYYLKKEWDSLLDIPSEKKRDFFKVMEEHQYKKHWDDIEMNNVIQTFHEFKKSVD